ncbi:ribonucleotide reductase subunit alpha [Aestuariibacter halophilus]|uniref:Ribonucleotide reductase subunit alpha n=1 Tax=Fluctibacter halophilus TaxID=226011 RepID=A0ABS8G3L4_9ALTE|nr:ribonucleotide reductase subunit alpha [Aestuariibacter halophilus]MCC2615048.1 ribonucleotide reductase subunit alpha [Aestuariibacter halophilus]
MESHFNQLLRMAHEQETPQRLLFLFASAKTSNKSRKQEEKKGTIEPTMVVDKLPEELSDFNTLVNEADGISKAWDFVFIASLGGDGDFPPSSDDAEPFLNQMTNDVATGNNIMRYVVFDRQENPIELSAH